MKAYNFQRFITLVIVLIFTICGINAQAQSTMPSDTTPTSTTTTTTTTTTAAPSAQDVDDDYNEKARFGIRAGGIISKYAFESDDPTDDPESKFGLDLAILVAIPIGDGVFMLQPELHWMQKGYKLEDIQTGDDITSTLNYLELPLLLRLNFGESVKLFAFAGPSVGWLLDGELNSATESLDASEILDQTEYNAHLGLGIGLGPVEIDVRYIAGLSDISDADNFDEVRNSSFGVGVTLKF
jgi:hypothetical protein